MKSLIVSICILSLMGMVISMTVKGDLTGTVSTTVSARQLCINRTDAQGTINYGSEDLGESTSTEPAGQNKTVTFDNCGSQAKFNIKTSAATGGTQWDPAETTGTLDQFVHAFATTTAVAWQVLGTVNTYETASSTVDTTVDVNFYFRITIPTSVTDYQQKSITLTAQAAAP